MWDIPILLAIISGSIAVGFFAGLLGIGGGMILEPLILWILDMQNIHTAHAQHIAVGTSFAVMVFTSFSSALAQHRKGAVRWNIVRGMVPALLAGTLAGAAIARYLPHKGLQLFFILYAIIFGIQTLTRYTPKAERHMPAGAGLNAAGGIIGLISSWVGIGGGSMSVPFMLWCNIPVHHAVGTAAALGWPIALSGALGYLISGWSAQGLPAHTLGFWYIPLAAIMAVTTILIAPLGVRVAHLLPAAHLKRAVGILMLVIAAQMLWKW